MVYRLPFNSKLLALVLLPAVLLFSVPTPKAEAQTVSQAARCHSLYLLANIGAFRGKRHRTFNRSRARRERAERYIRRINQKQARSILVRDAKAYGRSLQRMRNNPKRLRATIINGFKRCARYRF